MKTTRNALFALLLLGGTAGAASAATSVSAGIHVGPSGRSLGGLGFFYDDLAPYGNWIERPSYGWVWTPRAVSASWRPYQDGHWVWTDEGWTWISDEPYGWATYHYGRWYDDPEIGWAWVPGDEWAPAWVSWQEGNDYVGWAPLPPGVNISGELSAGGYGRLRLRHRARGLRLRARAHFLSPRIAGYVVPRPQIDGVFRQTRNCTNYRNPAAAASTRACRSSASSASAGCPATRWPTSARYAEYRHAAEPVSQGDRLEIFRPQVQRGRVAPPISRAAARRAVVSAAQFRAANPNRVARMNQRQNRQFQQAQVNQRQTRVDQRQVRVDQRQAKVDRQQVRVDRRSSRRRSTAGVRTSASSRRSRLSSSGRSASTRSRLGSSRSRRTSPGSRSGWIAGSSRRRPTAGARTSASSRRPWPISGSRSA